MTVQSSSMIDLNRTCTDRERMSLDMTKLQRFSPRPYPGGIGVAGSNPAAPTTFPHFLEHPSNLRPSFPLVACLFTGLRERVCRSGAVS